MAEEKMVVTPWEVKGDVDYDKLVKEFGTKKIDDALLERIKKHTGELHPALRRGIFYSHRDLNWLLDEYDKGNKFFLYTGRGPSSATHIGHISPYVFTKWLQDKFDVEVYYQLTDDEKFLFKDNLELEEVNNFSYENALDFIAVGFDPEKTKIIIDTKAIKSLYTTAIRVARKITYSTTKAVFGFGPDCNVGQIFFTSIQATPAFLPSVMAKKNIPCLIPMGIDQDPHFRIARDVAPKLGFYKPACIHKKLFPGLSAEGKGKMSASVSSTSIYVTDTEKEVHDKIMKYAFSGGRETVAEHRKLGGNPDIDVCYQMLEAMFEPDDKKLKEIYQDYKSGNLLTGELKEITIEKINAFLKEHQRKREAAKKTIDKFIFKD
jgi:tryptophanyl-tRNA synthetase